MICPVKQFAILYIFSVLLIICVATNFTVYTNFISISLILLCKDVVFNFAAQRKYESMKVIKPRKTKQYAFVHTESTSLAVAEKPRDASSHQIFS